MRSMKGFRCDDISFRSAVLVVDDDYVFDAIGRCAFPDGVVPNRDYGRRVRKAFKNRNRSYDDVSFVFKSFVSWEPRTIPPMPTAQ